MKKKIISEKEEVKVHYPIKWEFEAFKELRDWCIERWNNDEEFLNEVQLNRLIIENLENDKTNFRQFAFQSEDKELTKFYQFIFDGFIIREPILFRIFLHNSTLPEDIHIREALRLTSIPNKEIKRFRDYFQRDLLINSEIANSILLSGKPVKGIHLRCFLIGHIINRLIEDYEHYALIDEIKKKGAQEPIEALRKNRIYESNEGIVHDYSPIFKKTYTNKEIMIEYFEKEDFENINWLSYQLDDLLCGSIQKTQHDGRQEYYFGNNLDTSEFRFIICFEGQKKEIPFQLLPKYKPLILTKVSNYSLTEIETENNSNEKKIKEDEKQEAILGLFKGAMTWDINKGASTSHLSKKVKRQLGNAFDKLSTEVDKKRRFEEHKLETRPDKHFQEKILKEVIESSGGHLQGVLDEKGDIRIEDTISDKDSLSPLGKIEYDENKRTKVKNEIEKNPKIQNILDKQERKECLTAQERKTLQRFRDNLKKKYSI